MIVMTKTIVIERKRWLPNYVGLKAAGTRIQVIRIANLEFAGELYERILIPTGLMLKVTPRDSDSGP